MPRSFLICLAAITALVALWGCDTRGEQSEFAAQALSGPDGFTQTDENGEIIGAEDPDDWRTAPLYEGRVIVEPAFPNPVQAGETITIGVNLLGFQGVPQGIRIDALRSDGQQTFEVERRSDIDSDGFFPITLNLFAATGEEGLTRVLLFDLGRGSIVSYGDVMIEAADSTDE